LKRQYGHQNIEFAKLNLQLKKLNTLIAKSEKEQNNGNIEKFIERAKNILKRIRSIELKRISTSKDHE